MDAKVRRGYDRSRRFWNKKFKAGCYAPFTSMYFDTFGNVVACCRNFTSVLGNVTHDRLDDIWNGPKIQEMRDHLARYEFSGGCEVCEWLICAGDHSGTTARLYDRYKVESEHPAYPKLMEFALSNTCNFACVQCCGRWSSTIRAHRECMPPIPRVYGDEFFADLRNYLPHLERAKFFGGEPFLMEETYRVWDMLIEDGLKPSCQVLTNGSQWTSKVERVLDRLKFEIAVSLDAITSKDALESIRVGADYDTVLKNMARFREYTRANGELMSISFSLMKQNWRELIPMLQHCGEHGYEIYVIRVVDPSQFSLFDLPPADLLNIADELEAGRRAVPRRLRGRLDTVVQSLRNSANEKQAEGYADVKAVWSSARQNHAVAAHELLAEERWEEAIDEARKLPKSHKDYVHSLLAMAHAHRRLGRLDSAEAILDEAVGLTRRYPTVFVERAWLRHEQARFSEGVTEAERALETYDKYELGGEKDVETASWIAHCLGHMYYAVSDYSSAIPPLEKFLGTHVDDEDAQHLLDRCRAAIEGS